MTTGRPSIDLTLPHYSDDFNTNHDPFVVKDLLTRDLQSFGGLDAYGGEVDKLTWASYSGQAVSRGGGLYAKQTSGVYTIAGFGPLGSPQYYTVPSGAVGPFSLLVKGGDGGMGADDDDIGGGGGVIYVVLKGLSPGDVLTMYVGAKGGDAAFYGNGGHSGGYAGAGGGTGSIFSGGGGGATVVLINGDLAFFAGGGGGGGFYFGAPSTLGQGGYLQTGEITLPVVDFYAPGTGSPSPPTSSFNSGQGGFPGTTSPGAGGAGSPGGGNSGQPGVGHRGGNGAVSGVNPYPYGGGGGGGGYCGGGGGGAGHFYGGQGGGGSSWMNENYINTYSGASGSSFPSEGRVELYFGVAEPALTGLQVQPYPDITEEVNANSFLLLTQRMSNVAPIVEGSVSFPTIADPFFDQWSGQSLPVLDVMSMNGGFNFPYELYIKKVLELLEEGGELDFETLWNDLIGPGNRIYQSVLLYGVQCRTFGQLTEADILDQRTELNNVYPGVGSIVFDQMVPGDGLLVFMNLVDNYLTAQKIGENPVVSEMMAMAMSFYKIAPGGSLDFYSGRDSSFVYGDVTSKSQMSFLYGMRQSADISDDFPVSVSITPMANEGDTQLNYRELSQTLLGERYHGPYFHNPNPVPLYGLRITTSSFTGLNWVNGGGRKVGGGGWRIGRVGID